MTVSKKQLIADILYEKAVAEASGQTFEAGLNLATRIAASALQAQRLRDGSDYMSHPLAVAFMNTDSPTKQIVGVLHDVVEDSDWTLEDLARVGFSERVVRGVDGVTKRDGELYFDFIERCGQSGIDAIDVKIKDLTHNSDQSRTPALSWNKDDVARLAKYNVSKFYLIAIKREDIEPGTSIIDFIKTMPAYTAHPYEANDLLDRFSSNSDRISPYAPGGAYNPLIAEPVTS